MVKLQVLISMELEGVTDVQPAEEDYEYFFNVTCGSCREPHPKVISLNQTEEHEISGSRGSAHFVWRCQNCKKEHSASFVPPTSSTKSTAPLPFSEENGKFAPFIALDCRGLEFTKLHFRGKWKCKGTETGTPFEMELNEEDEDGRWDDYDEKAGTPVGISELKCKIQRL
ncbi:hypothetical protein BD324DRAFT_618509 [Kockovaella imperatae]|uniref:DUF866-domain-containing protein n=1 Tax=Kockovaella imperatae TaxID=4999 RepID=A0A1Y1UM10_9TREE|nr:hypothetical protein BD324DRAFT_618509 [Kockovaella imperatae]ORX39098.1 hypothetical protein BD324DRAFT_618509 [Kockovaella imperatae]